jgi:hypothetical protein
VLVRGRDGTFRQPTGGGKCVAWLTRRGGCRRARGLHGVADTLVSDDGGSLYAATSFGWAAFRRLSDGTLRQLPGRSACGTWDEEEPEGCLINDVPWVGLEHLAISPDGRHAYLADELTVGGLRRLP